MTCGSEGFARFLTKLEGLWERPIRAYLVVSVTIPRNFDEGLACSPKLRESDTFSMAEVTGLRYVRMAHGGTATKMEHVSVRAGAESVKAGAMDRTV
jgi:hypothetical protein